MLVHQVIMQDYVKGSKCHNKGSCERSEFFVAEGQGSTYPRLCVPLLLISKRSGMLCSLTKNFRT